MIKMNILPKVIFLFQNLPIKLEQKCFEDLNTLVTKFIWQRKKPRIKRKLLQDAKERGGFGLPNWNLYYQASVLNWIKEWIKLKNKRILYLEGT